VTIAASFKKAGEAERAFARVRSALSEDEHSGAFVLGSTLFIPELADVDADRWAHPVRELLEQLGASVLQERRSHGESIVMDLVADGAPPMVTRRIGEQLELHRSLPYFFWARPPWSPGAPLSIDERIARMKIVGYMNRASASMSVGERINESERGFELIQQFTQLNAGDPRLMLPENIEKIQRAIEAHARQGAAGMSPSIEEQDADELAEMYAAFVRATPYSSEGLQIAQQMGAIAGGRPVQRDDRGGAAIGAPQSFRPVDEALNVAAIYQLEVSRREISLRWMVFERIADGLPALLAYLHENGFAGFRYDLADFDSVRP
jgi:hypothetical protein